MTNIQRNWNRPFKFFLTLVNDVVYQTLMGVQGHIVRPKKSCETETLECAKKIEGKTANVLMSVSISQLFHVKVRPQPL